MEAFMSQTHNTDRADREIRKAQQRIKEQKERLRRTIVQGCPTQSTDDILRDMESALRQMQQARRIPR
jgi:tRNA A37 methylthiotransferase MiaB